MLNKNNIYLLLFFCLLPSYHYAMEMKEKESEAINSNNENEILPIVKMYQPSMLKDLCIQKILKEYDQEQLVEMITHIDLPASIALKTSKAILQEGYHEDLIPTLMKLPPCIFPALQLFITSSPLNISLYDKSKILHNMLVHQGLNDQQKIILKFFDQQYKHIFERNSKKNYFIGANQTYNDEISQTTLMQQACVFFDSSEPLCFLKEQEIQLPENIVTAILDRGYSKCSAQENLARLKLLLEKGAVIPKGDLIPICSCNAFNHDDCQNVKLIPRGPLARIAGQLRRGKADSKKHNFYMKIQDLFNQFDK